MFDQSEREKPINATVLDGIITVQLIEKALRSGIIQGSEMNMVSSTRQRLVEGIQQATGKNYDELLQNRLSGEEQQGEE